MTRRPRTAGGPHTTGGPRILDPYAGTPSPPAAQHAATAVRARTRASFGARGLVVAVVGPHADDAVLAVHRAALTPTYVVPRPAQADVVGAVLAARQASNPAVIFLPGFPRTSNDILALIAADVKLPGDGLVIRLGTALGVQQIEDALRTHALWELYKTAPAESPEDAAVALIHLTGLRR